MSDPPYHSELSDVPYSPNQFLGWEVFCHFLQQDGSNLIWWKQHLAKYLFNPRINYPSHRLITCWILNLPIFSQNFLCFVFLRVRSFWLKFLVEAYANITVYFTKLNTETILKNQYNSRLDYANAEPVKNYGINWILKREFRTGCNWILLSKVHVF